MNLSSGDKVLVTGGTGVIGAWIVREFVENGYRPVVLTRGMTSVADRILKDVRGEIEFKTGDMEQPWSIVHAIQSAKPRGIIHLASAKPWQVDVGFVPYPNPVSGMNSIVGGTATMLEACRNFDIGCLVYASSKSAYSDFQGDYVYPRCLPVPEDHPCNPSTVYGIGKRTAELLGAYYARHLGVDFRAARFGTTYGPFKRGGGNHPSTIITRAAAGEPTRFSIAEHFLTEVFDDYVYNRDIARGIRMLAEAKKPTQSVYNIATGTGNNLEQVVQQVRDAFPEAVIDVSVDESAGNAGIHVMSHAAKLDISAAERDLGYLPAYDLARGIRDTASFY